LLDFVELDVQLSADGVPVVYHDWTVRVDALGAGLRSIALRVPVGHIDAAQLQSLAQLPSRCSRGLSNGAQRVYSEMQWAHDYKTNETPILRKCEHHVDDRVLLHSKAARRFASLGIDISPESLARIGDTFDGHGLRNGGREGGVPSLAAVLSAASLPRTCGVNVELKYPTSEECAILGLRVPERFAFVAAILKVVEASPARKIMYSSFDPDVAKIARGAAPPDTPVFFLTEGDGGAEAADPRMRSFESALDWAESAGLDGVVTHTSPVLRAPVAAVAAARAKGLLLATYGLRNNTSEAVKVQIEAGVDMIILDDARAAAISRAPVSVGLL
jgi:glycerophosphodiester phosphodiesterase